MSRVVPEVGRWYQDTAGGQLFEIVAIDHDEGNVQIQFFDGEIADYDLEIWGDMALVSAAAPEDWRSAFELDDDLQTDPDDAMHPLQWANPVTRIEPEATLGIEDL